MHDLLRRLFFGEEETEEEIEAEVETRAERRNEQFDAWADAMREVERVQRLAGGQRRPHR